MRRPLDWSDLHTFLAVAEAGSLSKAARALKTTQPTVSKRIDDLELRLGAQLLVRGKGGASLTDCGRFVAEQVSAMSRSVQHIEHEVAMRDFAPEGEVHLLCPDGLATYFVGPALPALHRVFPDILLNVRARADEQQPPDISIQFHETKRMDDVAIPLGWLHHSAFAAQSYLDLYGEPHSIGDAFQHRVLTSLDYGAQTERWRPKQKGLQEMLDFVLRTDCGPFLLAAVASGAGLASLPTYVAHVETRLRMLDFGELARIQFWLVFDRARGELPRVRETIKWLRGAFDSRHNPWFREEFISPDQFAEAMRGQGRGG